MAKKKKGQSIVERWNAEVPEQFKCSPNKKVSKAEQERAKKMAEAFLRAKNRKST